MAAKAKAKATHVRHRARPRTRQWSRAFTPHGPKVVNLSVTGIPPTLRNKFAAKCKRVGQSQRNLLLGWIRSWVEDKPHDDPRQTPAVPACIERTDTNHDPLL